MIEELRFLSLFSMLTIGSYFDLFNKRQIPAIIFIPPLIISMGFFIVEFSIPTVFIVSLWFIACFFLSRYRLWYGADTLSLMAIAMSYPFLSPYIFMYGSAPYSISYMIHGLAKKKSFIQIMKTRMPFLPALWLGLVIIFLLRLYQSVNVWGAVIWIGNIIFTAF